MFTPIENALFYPIFASLNRTARQTKMLCLAGWDTQKKPQSHTRFILFGLNQPIVQMSIIPFKSLGLFMYLFIEINTFYLAIKHSIKKWQQRHL